MNDFVQKYGPWPLVTCASFRIVMKFARQKSLQHLRGAWTCPGKVFFRD